VAFLVGQAKRVARNLWTVNGVCPVREKPQCRHYLVGAWQVRCATKGDLVPDVLPVYWRHQARERSAFALSSVLSPIHKVLSRQSPGRPPKSGKQQIEKENQRGKITKTTHSQSFGR
jgi:hypothetical protein